MFGVGRVQGRKWFLFVVFRPLGALGSSTRPVVIGMGQQYASHWGCTSSEDRDRRSGLTIVTTVNATASGSLSWTSGAELDTEFPVPIRFPTRMKLVAELVLQERLRGLRSRTVGG